VQNCASIFDLGHLDALCFLAIYQKSEAYTYSANNELPSDLGTSGALSQFFTGDEKRETWPKLLLKRSSSKTQRI